MKNKISKQSKYLMPVKLTRIMKNKITSVDVVVGKKGKYFYSLLAEISTGPTILGNNLNIS